MGRDSDLTIDIPWVNPPTYFPFSPPSSTAGGAGRTVRRSASGLLREEEDEEAEHAAHDPLQHRAPLRDVARVDSRRRRLLPPSSAAAAIAARPLAAAAEHNDSSSRRLLDIVGAAKEGLGKRAGTGAEVARDGDSVTAWKERVTGDHVAPLPWEKLVALPQRAPPICG